MQRFMVAYRVPDAGQLSAMELVAVAAQWQRVLDEMGPGITLELTCVTEDRIYAVYLAGDVQLIHEHARLAGLPASEVRIVRAYTNPAEP
jgi:hypothetical protein